MKYVGAIIRGIFLIGFLLLIANGKMMLWLGVFAISLLVAMFFGRLYCGYACPMNTVMIGVEWISKKLKIQTNKIPRWLQSGKIPWVTLTLSIVLMISMKRVWQINLPILLIWLFISIFMTLRYRPYVFHNLLCPFGILQKTFGRFSRYSKNVNSNKCVGCKLCVGVCPTEAIKVNNEKKAKIDTALCLQCTNCSQVCPKEAIQYDKLRL